MILDGALDGGTEADLGARLGISARHLRRLFTANLGVTPDQLARSIRAHFARRLLDDTDLTITEIAFASGFGSVRQLNRVCRDIFRSSPRELRARRRSTDRLVADGGLVLRLPFRGPLDWTGILGCLESHAIRGVERVCEGVYRRTIVVGGDPGVIELSPGGADHLLLRAHLSHWEGLIHIVERVRRVFSLDVPIDEAFEHLSRTPIIGELIKVRPGLRVPGTWDPFEVGLHAIVGDEVGGPRATEIMGRIADRFGTPVDGLHKLDLTHTFPAPHLLADGDLSGMGIPEVQAVALKRFARAVEGGTTKLDGSLTLDQLVSSISALESVGPSTAHYVALRLGERDAWPADDPELQRSLERMAAGLQPTIDNLAKDWSPWRAIAAVHLWLADASAPPWKTAPAAKQEARTSNFESRAARAMNRSAPVNQSGDGI